jgi:uncharacterized membrane protein YczE
MSPGVRVARLLVGVTIVSVAFCLLVRADLGLGPWHVLQQGVSRQFHIPIGSALWITGGGLILVGLLLREYPGIGTLAAVFLGGAEIDWMLPHFGHPTALVLRVALLFASLAVMSFGAAVYMSADLGRSPLDAVMTGVYRRLPYPLFGVRLGLEVIGLAAGLASGGDLGVGCLLIGVGIGPGIHLFLHLLDAMPDHGEEPAAEAMLEPAVP